jgi:membrane fusion protein, multidrug efflux system
VLAIAVSRDRSEELDRGTVALVDNQIDPTTGTVRVKATFPNARRKLWPGQFINVKVLTETKRQAVTIPASALQRGPNGVFAYVVQADSTVEPAALTLGGTAGDLVVVETGLEAGQKVAASNQFRLQPKAHVRSSAADAVPGKPARAHAP